MNPWKKYVNKNKRWCITIPDIKNTLDSNYKVLLVPFLESIFHDEGTVLETTDFLIRFLNDWMDDVYE